MEDTYIRAKGSQGFRLCYWILYTIYDPEYKCLLQASSIAGRLQSWTMAESTIQRIMRAVRPLEGVVELMPPCGRRPEQSSSSSNLLPVYFQGSDLRAEKQTCSQSTSQNKGADVWAVVLRLCVVFLRQDQFSGCSFYAARAEPSSATSRSDHRPTQQELGADLWLASARRCAPLRSRRQSSRESTNDSGRRRFLMAARGGSPTTFDTEDSLQPAARATCS